jgi:hypothetical protein
MIVAKMAHDPTLTQSVSIQPRPRLEPPSVKRVPKFRIKFRKLLQGNTDMRQRKIGNDVWQDRGNQVSPKGEKN